MTEPVAPDDTPTRHTPGLVEILNRDQLLAEVSRLREDIETRTRLAEDHYQLLRQKLEQAEAEVSRLRSENEELQSDTDDRNAQIQEQLATAEADVSRLQQENARLVERERRAVEAHASWYDVPAIVDENARLQAENGLLKRSLGILERTISEAEGR